MTKRLTLNDKTFVFQIWDTAGQEKVTCKLLFYLKPGHLHFIKIDQEIH